MNQDRQSGKVMPVYFVIDHSRSASVAFLQQVRTSIETIVGNLRLDAVSKANADFTVGTCVFADEASMLPSSCASTYSLPELVRCGRDGCMLGAALHLIFGELDSRWDDIPSYRPMLFIHSTGAATDEWEITAEQLVAHKATLIWVQLEAAFCDEVFERARQHANSHVVHITPEHLEQEGERLKLGLCLAQDEAAAERKKQRKRDQVEVCRDVYLLVDVSHSAGEECLRNFGRAIRVMLEHWWAHECLEQQIRVTVLACAEQATVVVESRSPGSCGDLDLSCSRHPKMNLGAAMTIVKKLHRQKRCEKEMRNDLPPVVLILAAGPTTGHWRVAAAKLRDEALAEFAVGYCSQARSSRPLCELGITGTLRVGAGLPTHSYDQGWLHAMRWTFTPYYCCLDVPGEKRAAISETIRSVFGWLFERPEALPPPPTEVLLVP